MRTGGHGDARGASGLRIHYNAPHLVQIRGREETVRSLRRRVAQVIETMDPAVAPQPRPTDVIIAMVLEAAAQEAEAFSWVLPMYNRPDLDQATDDAACAVQEQIAAALRARARAYIERP
jgi:hypothetical protein